MVIYLSYTFDGVISARRTTKLACRPPGPGPCPAWGSCSPCSATGSARSGRPAPEPACTRDTPRARTCWCFSFRSYACWPDPDSTPGTVPGTKKKGQHYFLEVHPSAVPTCCLVMLGNRTSNSGKISWNRSPKATLQCS